jgi:NADH-quinone oxidoreductase subunit G
VIVGGGALNKGQGASLALIETLGLVKDGWNGYNVLHMAASRMGGLMLGYAQDGGIAAVAAKSPKLVFLLGADEVSRRSLPRRAQGLCRPSWRQGRAYRRT